jgi:hypothetical protein
MPVGTVVGNIIQDNLLADDAALSLQNRLPKTNVTVDPT